MNKTHIQEVINNGFFLEVGGGVILDLLTLEARSVRGGVIGKLNLDNPTRYKRRRKKEESNG